MACGVALARPQACVSRLAWASQPAAAASTQAGARRHEPPSAHGQPAVAAAGLCGQGAAEPQPLSPGGRGAALLVLLRLAALQHLLRGPARQGEAAASAAQADWERRRVEAREVAGCLERLTALLAAVHEALVRYGNPAVEHGGGDAETRRDTGLSNGAWEVGSDTFAGDGLGVQGAAGCPAGGGPAPGQPGAGGRGGGCMLDLAAVAGGGEAVALLTVSEALLEVRSERHGESKGRRKKPVPAG
jgi:hypothetical protein